MVPGRRKRQVRGKGYFRGCAYILKYVPSLADVRRVFFVLQEHKSRFLLIIVNLACIETIICLDDIALEVAVEASAEMLMACYSVMESTISYMVNDKLAMVDEKQKEQVSAKHVEFFSFFSIM